VHHGSPRLWTPEETALVSETAERTWAAIERARAEEALRESEENLRLLIKSIKEYAIFTIDKERRVRIWNPGAEQIFGWTAEEIIGQSSDIIFTPEDRENGIPEQEINTANAEGRAADERWHVRKDGSRFFVNGVVMPLSDNGTGGFVKIARDLTEQMLAAETLRASEERLKLATEAAALGSWDWDYRKDEMIWTKQLFDIFGLEPTKEMKVEFEEIKQYFHQEDLPLLIETSRQAWENQGSFKMEYRIRRADTGEERWISAHETFFYDEKKQPVRGVGIAQDITERKQAEQILLQSREELEKAVEKRTEELKNTNRALQKETEVRLSMERERVNLLQQIVHTQEDERKRIARDMHDQLGQQLVALRLKLDSLKAECDEGSQLGEMVEDAERVARRIDSDINFLARELRPVALDDLGLKIALDNYVSEWSKHFNIPAELHAEGLSYEQLPVEIEINLYRIVQEALNNAAKHSSAERVEVLIETRDNTLILIIEDNGKGFDESQITLRRDKGLGILGMKERALLIGGTLEIETGEGKGTTIFVRVPIESDKK
jgi:PAS domain S-box-containing protein